MKVFFISILLLVPGASSVAAGFHEFSADVPFDGGGVAFYSRMWRWNRHFDAGWTVGGGVVKRELSVVSGADPSLDTLDLESTVFPFVGPRLTFRFYVFEITGAILLYHADTDLRASSNSGEFRGSHRGWGWATHTPFVLLDFYHAPSNMTFGFGLGGLGGISRPHLEATSPSGRIVADESPVQSLTVHARTRWGGRRTAAEDQSTW